MIAGVIVSIFWPTSQSKTSLPGPKAKLENLMPGVIRLLSKRQSFLGLLPLFCSFSYQKLLYKIDKGFCKVNLGLEVSKATKTPF